MTDPAGRPPADAEGTPSPPSGPPLDPQHGLGSTMAAEEGEGSPALLTDPAAPEPVLDPDQPGEDVDPWRAGSQHVLGTNHGAVTFGFLVAAGALGAFWLGTLLLSLSSILVLVVVAMFLAVGLNPAVDFFVRRGLRRQWAVLVVIGVVVAVVALFVVALVPVLTDQVDAIIANAPVWLDTLQSNRQIQLLDQRFDILDRLRTTLEAGGWTGSLFGGVVGVGLAVVSVLANAFIVVVLTLYFLSSLETVKSSLFRLAPASQRERVTHLGERILENVGAYVSGAFIVATFAGLSSLAFLFVIGLSAYAVALALVVAVLDVIPMIGATLGAVLVTAIAFANDPGAGLWALGFYIVYQQVENYLIYPRVMERSVNLPGSVIVIAALAGATLLGVVGALLAIPTAAAIILLVREVYVPRQDAR